MNGKTRHPGAVPFDVLQLKPQQLVLLQADTDIVALSCTCYWCCDAPFAC